MAQLTVQNIEKTGLAAAYGAAASGGDTFENDGNTFLHVKNGATDVTVTVTAQNTTTTKPGYGTITLTNAVYTVSATSEGFIGPFEPSIFNSSNGQASISYDDNSNVTIAAIKLPPVL